MAENWPFRWDLLLRYRFIEVIALWEGRLTTRHLVDTFGIGRQQASKDINTYNREVGLDNLKYNKFIKGYEPSETFTPKVTRGESEEYLQLLANRSELHRTFSSIALPIGQTEILTPPLRPVAPEVLRPLLRAARDQQRIEVDYVSVNNPDREGRIIAPHTLVWTGLRWHVRGWCEKNRDYRDFVLSRFRGIPDILGPAEQSATADTEWNRIVTLRIVPDPRLTPAQQEVIAGDYGMDNNHLLISVRARLVSYLLQLLNINGREYLDDPRAQQVVIENLDDIRHWIF